MHRQILLSPKIHTDDIPVPARNGSAKEIHKGFLWTYIDILKNVVFDYTPGHSREGPLRFLGDYGGYVQADAYNGNRPAEYTEARNVTPGLSFWDGCYPK
jgi:hypothetical protein